MRSNKISSPYISISFWKACGYLCPKLLFGEGCCSRCCGDLPSSTQTSFQCCSNHRFCMQWWHWTGDILKLSGKSSKGTFHLLYISAVFESFFKRVMMRFRWVFLQTHQRHKYSCEWIKTNQQKIYVWQPFLCINEINCKVNFFYISKILRNYYYFK